MLAVTFLMSAYPETAERAGRAAARLARHVGKNIDPDAIGRSCGRLAALNIASAPPLTSGAPGIIEVTLAAISAGFGVPPGTSARASR